MRNVVSLKLWNLEYILVYGVSEMRQSKGELEYGVEKVRLYLGIKRVVVVQGK